MSGKHFLHSYFSAKILNVFFLDIYHATFDPATDPDVAIRLIPDPNSAEDQMVKRLAEYHRWVLSSW